MGDFTVNTCLLCTNAIVGVARIFLKVGTLAFNLTVDDLKAVKISQKKSQEVEEPKP